MSHFRLFWKRNNPNQLAYLPFSLKRAASPSELLIYLITSKIKELVLEELNMDVMVTQWKDKSNNSLRSFFKLCGTLIWNFNLVLRTSNSCEKFRERHVGKLLRAFDALGTTSENFQLSTKSDEISLSFLCNHCVKNRNQYSLYCFQIVFQLVLCLVTFL